MWVELGLWRWRARCSLRHSLQCRQPWLRGRWRRSPLRLTAPSSFLTGSLWVRVAMMSSVALPVMTPFWVAAEATRSSDSAAMTTSMLGRVTTGLMGAPHRCGQRRSALRRDPRFAVPTRPRRRRADRISWVHGRVLRPPDLTNGGQIRQLQLKSPLALGISASALLCDRRLLPSQPGGIGSTNGPGDQPEGAGALWWAGRAKIQHARVASGRGPGTSRDRANTL